MEKSTSDESSTTAAIQPKLGVEIAEYYDKQNNSREESEGESEGERVTTTTGGSKDSYRSMIT
ncbi:hypothetical protein T07_10168 [Trichinella nelsoni]|uniref:Uncharacterized protein n=1 Tax=Trichinella nelsoni TaxID=6336 RepID=A0A0V0RD83_9BILA|nr:hypothetical protein T07_10168 [Trichinella nelsoni]